MEENTYNENPGFGDVEILNKLVYKKICCREYNTTRNAINDVFSAYYNVPTTKYH